MSASYESYDIRLTTWIGATEEARAAVEDTLLGAISNGCPAFPGADVTIDERGSITVSVQFDGTGPWDACDFLKSCVEDDLVEHAPGVFQDGPEADGETWCAALSVKHAEWDQ